MADEQGQKAEEGTCTVKREDGAALIEAGIGQAVRGMILARRGERDEAATRSGNRNQGGVEDGNAQDQNRDYPLSGLWHPRQAKLQSQRGHHETEKHGPAVTHKDLRRFEIPAENTERSAQDGGAQR